MAIEQDQLSSIFKVSDILGQMMHLREQDIKLVLNYVSEHQPKLKDYFDCLTQTQSREIVDGIGLELLNQGQKLFVKDQHIDEAFLLIFGNVSLFDPQRFDSDLNTTNKSTSYFGKIQSPKSGTVTSLKDLKSVEEVIDENKEGTLESMERTNERMESKERTNELNRSKDGSNMINDDMSREVYDDSLSKDNMTKTGESIEDEQERGSTYLSID